jgi:hypothetical protein
MAIFRYSMGDRVSRSGGGSSVRTAAYLSRECFEDQRTGWRHDFTGERSPVHEAADHIIRAGRHAELGSKQEVLFSGLYAPEGAPDWCKGAENIERFWNAAEAAEKRGDAQIAERVIIALPHEMTLEQARWAVQDHVREFTRQGRVVQVAIHSPEPGHDERNMHAHLLISTRGVDENGLKATKAVEQKERFMNRSAYVERLREAWAHVVNRHLMRHGVEAKLDHRSYQRQGIGREPEQHMGPGDADRERRGLRTVIGDHNRGVRERNAAAERVRLEREQWADKVGSGWRFLTVQDVAREQSFTYRQAQRIVERLGKAMEKAQNAAAFGHGKAYAAEQRIVERQAQRGVVGRTASWLLGITDKEIAAAEKERRHGLAIAKKYERKRDNFGTRRALATVAAKAAFALARPAAELELQRRQQTARAAREGLERLDWAERERESYRRGESPGADRRVRQRRGRGMSR